MLYIAVLLVAITACGLVFTGCDAAPITNKHTAEKSNVIAVEQNEVKPKPKEANYNAERPNSDSAQMILDGMKPVVIPDAEKSVTHNRVTASPARLQLVPGGSGIPEDKESKTVLQRLDSLKEAKEDGDQVPTDFDLSKALDPQLVAEYLFMTGDFSGFDDTVENLIKARLLDPKDITEYAELVSQEYEALVKALLERQEEEAEAEEDERNADMPDLENLYKLVSRLPVEEQATLLAKVKEYAQQKQPELNRNSAESAETELEQSEAGSEESNEEDELRRLTDTGSKETEHNNNAVKNPTQQDKEVAEGKQTETKAKNEDLSKKSIH